MAINKISSEDAILEIIDVDYHWPKVIDEKQKEYNSLKHKIISLKAQYRNNAEAMKNLKYFEDQAIRIEEWAEEEGIEIVKNIDQEKKPVKQVNEDGKLFFITGRYIFVPPTDNQKLILKKQDGKKGKTKSNNKGGRPADPKIAERNAKLRHDYYNLTTKEHLNTKEAIKRLSIKYSLATSTIEKYLK